MSEYIDILEQIEADLEEAITLGPPVDQVELEKNPSTNPPIGTRSGSDRKEVP